MLLSFEGLFLYPPVVRQALEKLRELSLCLGTVEGIGKDNLFVGLTAYIQSAGLVECRCPILPNELDSVGTE